jgi:hypothetical protein
MILKGSAKVIKLIRMKNNIKNKVKKIKNNMNIMHI